MTTPDATPTPATPTPAAAERNPLLYVQELDDQVALTTTLATVTGHLDRAEALLGARGREAGFDPTTTAAGNLTLAMKALVAGLQAQQATLTPVLQHGHADLFTARFLVNVLKAAEPDGDYPSIEVLLIETLCRVLGRTLILLGPDADKDDDRMNALVEARMGHTEAWLKHWAAAEVAREAS